GGPPAINRILATLDPWVSCGIVVTQHMPAKFTRAFAERLDRPTAWRVLEAGAGDTGAMGAGVVGPGAGVRALQRRGKRARGGGGGWGGGRSGRGMGGCGGGRGCWGGGRGWWGGFCWGGGSGGWGGRAIAA